MPQRVVTNEELVAEFPEITPEYIYQVTGIRQRRWAAAGEKPSDMAYKAALEAIRASGVDAKDIDAVIVATTTPDVAMPSTAAILQDRLNLQTIPGFDLNAACSGWLYAVSAAQGMILSGTAHTVLTVGTDMQSQLLDKSDRSAYFLFGDGAGAAIISSGGNRRRIHRVVLGSDTRGLHMARRCEPGYAVRNGHGGIDPWIRIDGPALFRFATESFTTIIREAIAKQRLEPRRNPLDYPAPGQRPDSEGRRETQRRGLRTLLPQRGSRGKHFQRQHPPGDHRGRKRPPAGRQAGALLGRGGHDHGGGLRRMVSRFRFYRAVAMAFTSSYPSQVTRVVAPGWPDLI